MIGTDTILNSPVRVIIGKVELYNGSTLINTFNHDDRLQEVTIERVGESKFFGFGICQKANIKLIDKNRELNITTENSNKVYLNNTCFAPLFHVTEVNRDENTNELSITAYDKLYNAGEQLVSELTLPMEERDIEVEVEDEDGNTITTTEKQEVTVYTIEEFATACVALLGLNGLVVKNVTDNCFSTLYDGGANFGGTETIRDALDDIAEATQTIYYLDNDNNLVFRRLNRDGEVDYTIDKSAYFTLDSKTNRRLSTITHATELGDNLTSSITDIGSTQYVRNNAFWEMRDDVATLVDNAVTNICGLTINQFECEWRGNYLLECGDKIGLVTKDNDTVISYLIDDVITYNGGLQQQTRWSYEEDSDEFGNSTNIGDVIHETYAKVDKVNKQIDIVVSDTEGTKEIMNSIQVNTDSISASVKTIEEYTETNIENMQENIALLEKEVESKVTSDDVQLTINQTLANGVESVTTSTGFTFNQNGLTIEKSDSEISTQITEDGMTVSKSGDVVLTANNVGVQAKNLHATTYLIIGNNSRFEDYDKDGEPRTGCFWISG